jgi:CBS domain containing-hemolysin-like protein
MNPLGICVAGVRRGASQRRDRGQLVARGSVGAAAALVAGTANASFLSGEALDTAANVISWIVLCVVPIVAIVVFWVIHVMPEKIAHKRHHPQRDGIQTLCLLSLVFGGLLWPIAWLWAYTRPVAYRMAYGTDKHEDYFAERGMQAREGRLSPEERAGLVRELEAMHVRGTLPPHLAHLRTELAAAPTPRAVPAAPAKGAV